MKSCLLCGGNMHIDLMGNASWWQCRKDRTHRMSLDEQSDLDDGKRNEKEIRESMSERQGKAK